MNDFKIEYEMTREKVNTIKCNSYYLHSKYAPIKEAKRLANEYYKPHHLHVVFGYGHGYLVEELIKKFQFNEPILLIDPLLDYKRIEFDLPKYERLYYVPLESSQKVSALAMELSSYSTNVTCITSHNYNHIFPNELVSVMKLVKDTLNKQVSNISTGAFFAESWQVNYALNIFNLNKDYSLKKLKKVYNKPVVVAAGGPSLTKQLPLIQEYRQKIILICAGSTINSLLKANIYPDYVVSIDGGEANYEHFKDIYLENTQIIYSAMNHYGIRDSFKENGFLFVPHVRSEMMLHLKKHFGEDYPILAGGGSVAHFALSAAKYMTTGPIALVGQDLAYTNNLTHASGNKNSSESKMDALHEQVEGYFGGMVDTDVKFKIMIETFNDLELYDKHENVVFNCTEGGAKLIEYKQITFADFLESYTAEEINLYKDFYHNHNSENKVSYWENEKIVYNKILRLLTEGISLIKCNKSSLLPPKTIKKIGKIEKKLNELYEEACLNVLLEPIIIFAEHEFLPALNETKEDETKRAREYVVRLYTLCKEAINAYIKKVENILDERDSNGV